jgi:hypothetical protein
MKHLLLFLLVSLSLTVQGQQIFPTNSQEEPEYHIDLNEALIVEKKLFKNDTLKYRYNQMKYYVKTILPYVDEAVRMFNYIDSSSMNMSKRNRRKFIRSNEKEIKEKFEDKLASLNITQGRYLVKLIHRQIRLNCYDVIKDLKNPVTAAYYQSWARLNGINLNEDYNPEKEPDLERIMRSLGYPLPL